MSRIRLVTMGGFRIHRRLLPPIRLATRKAEALFAYLAITGAPIQRDVVCALLWGDVPAPQARHSLRQTLTEIRASLRDEGPGALIAVDDLIELDTRRITVDVHMIERYYGHWTQRALSLACALCRGELLAGLDVKEAEFERWLTLQRARMRQLSIEVHERYVNDLIDHHDVTKGIQAAIRLLALDPLSERAHRTLMTLYARQGQLGAALRQYELCADILSRELNITPSHETQQLRLDLINARTAKRQVNGGRAEGAAGTFGGRAPS